MKKVLVVLLALVAVAVIVICTRPARYHIERSASVAAPPGVVYAQPIQLNNAALGAPWAPLNT